MKHKNGLKRNFIIVISEQNEIYQNLKRNTDFGGFQKMIYEYSVVY